MTQQEKQLRDKRRRRAKALKNPTPVELPSGVYRCQVTVNGKRLSITDPDPDTAHAKALALKASLIQQRKAPSELTVWEAMGRYIESKSAVLSPATIAGYKRIQKNAFPDLMSVTLRSLTQERVQRSVNAMSADHSPKTVRNAHGFLSVVLATYLPDLTLRTTLPQKQRHEIAIPEAGDLDRIFSAAAGTVLELPVLLAAWLGLRASEIRGITWDSIEGNQLHIRQAIVQGTDGPVLKGTKTYNGTRTLRLPDYILDLIFRQPAINEYVVQLSGQAMYKRFSRLCEREGLPHFRFHDLRHANASVMLALGVPDKYAMERMGHATPNMLKTVYQHTMADQQEAIADQIDEYFMAKLHTKLHTEKKSTQ